MGTDLVLFKYFVASLPHSGAWSWFCCFATGHPRDEDGFARAESLQQAWRSFLGEGSEVAVDGKSRCSEQALK